MGNDNKERWVAVIRSIAVRDAQYCVNTEYDLLDDAAWPDMPDAEIYLGIFDGPMSEALEKAASYAGTDPANIKLIAAWPPVRKKEQE